MVVPEDSAGQPSPARRTRPEPLRWEYRYPRGSIDGDALKVVRRLRQMGYEAYLVGGCVRDLLFGRIPQDFDVATSARPRQIRRVFRNSRVIGRRFRLVHVYFQQRTKIIEVATFRAQTVRGTPGDAEEHYGTAVEDALTRDFTINGLFYDPFGHRIIDYVGGLRDAAERRVRTIGDPDERLVEDPVRIVRGLRYGSIHALTIEDETWRAMNRNFSLLETVNRRRLLEEFWKILRCGATTRIFRVMCRLGDFRSLWPHVAILMPEFGGTGRFWEYVGLMDRELAGEESEGVLLSCVFLPLIEMLENPGENLGRDFAHLGVLYEQVVERFGRLHSMDRRVRNEVRIFLEFVLRFLTGRWPRRMKYDDPTLDCARRVFDVYSKIWGIEERKTKVRSRSRRRRRKSERMPPADDDQRNFDTAEDR